MTETFSLPEPGNEIIKVRDCHGVEWTRKDGFIETWEEPDGDRTEWKYLLVSNGPLLAIEFRPSEPTAFDLVRTMCGINADDETLLSKYSTKVTQAKDFIFKIKSSMGAERKIDEIINEPFDEDKRMDAYYYGFERTGVAIIDEILSQVAIAGKGSHHTDTWSDELDWEYYDSKLSFADRIQSAANDAAKRIVEAGNEKGYCE